MMTYDGYATHIFYILHSQGASPAQPSANRKRDKSKPKWRKKLRWALTALALTSLVGLVIVLSLVITRQSSDDADTAEDKSSTTNPVQLPLFFPYLSGQISNYDANGTKWIPFPGSVKWWILGTKLDEPVTGYVYIDKGYVYLTGGSYNSIIISASKTNKSYDKPEASKGQYFYVSGVESPEEKSLLSCLIPGFEVKVAFVYTWINFTLNGQPVGDFQIVLAYDDNSSTYVIRIYSDSVIDVMKAQFVFWFENIAYEESLTASDVRVTQQVYSLSQSPLDGHIQSLTVSDVCAV